MEIRVCKDKIALGQSAADYTAYLLNQAIKEKGSARIVLSTGASQFDTITALVDADVDWSKVEMFHLDEYVDLPETHIASFRKYLKERFVSKVNLKAAYFVDGTAEGIKRLTEEIRKSPVDVGLIGIGENAHIAFNDPPADFDTKDAYIIVNLNETCKKQQVGEGWFATVDDVPKQAVSMSVYQIMQCKHIISCVPYPVKANAIQATLENDVTNTVPATIMKTHPNFILYIDSDSFAQVCAKEILWK
ncbi:MAG: glucosamine-6-phosphate deaminase [Ruminococcaceae bacterium]|nr:glucosamine-6-phosphate deaminase [Oscillospiraceae bacterium]